MSKNLTKADVKIARRTSKLGGVKFTSFKALGIAAQNHRAAVGSSNIPFTEKVRIIQDTTVAQK